jgi:hypothetical protein
MVSPDTFGYNNETANSNVFQKQSNYDIETLREKAADEFQAMVDILNENGVDVFVSGIDSEDDLPDAVFPNNWVATYEGGIVVLFPMLSQARRKERDKSLIEEIYGSNDAEIKKIIDLTPYENEGLFLEGTGSLVIDRKSNTVFAAESERTSKTLFNRYCDEMNVSPNNRIFFHARDEQGSAIYHTNVMISIGEGFAVICDECIASSSEKSEVLRKLEELRLEIIKINYRQLKSFCANILNVKSHQGASLIVMSKNAYNAFTSAQIAQLEKHGKILAVDIDTIEKVGGGSARCMMAEIFFT